jgi:hypothetical protein
MNEDERPLLSRILLEATRQMLAGEGKSWEVIASEMGQVDFCGSLAASIGLGNPNGLRGKLVIVAQPDFFRSSYPAEIAASGISEDDLADWASEVANQLLGRIKNILSGYAVNFSMSIPAVVGGDRVRLLCRDRGSCIEYSVRVDGHPFDLLLEMERVPGRTIVGADGEHVAAAAEGTALLF